METLLHSTEATTKGAMTNGGGMDCAVPVRRTWAGTLMEASSNANGTSWTLQTDALHVDTRHASLASHWL